MAEYTPNERTLLEDLLRAGPQPLDRLTNEAMEMLPSLRQRGLVTTGSIRVMRQEGADEAVMVDGVMVSDETRSALGPALNADATTERYPRSNIKSEYLHVEDF